MHLDISRDSFDPTQQDPKNQQLQIFHEQGRVLIDAAHNQQVATMLHEMRMLAIAVKGRQWGPGFAISKELNIGNGDYFVDGYRCSPLADRKYADQPFYPLIPGIDGLLPPLPFMAYLDVWERLVTDVSCPELRDPALEQLDAPVASQLVWQVKVEPLTEAAAGTAATEANRKQAADTAINSLRETSTGTLRAKPVSSSNESDQHSSDLCEQDIDERYRGLENQLYRIEIHSSGSDLKSSNSTECATFKWSRDNGASIFPISSWATGSQNEKLVTVQLGHNGRDARSALKAGDFVEYQDEIVILRGDLVEKTQIPIAKSLLRVHSVDPYDPTLIKLAGEDLELPKAPEGWMFGDRRAFLRRWDHSQTQAVKVSSQTVQDSDTVVLREQSNTLLVIAGEDSIWIEIENGIQIQFSRGAYQRGDYWLIPARYATGRILWPTEAATPSSPGQSPQASKTVPKALLPRTIAHHYAPLAVVFDIAQAPTDCRP